MQQEHAPIDPQDLSEWIEIGHLLKVRGRIGELFAVFDASRPDRADELHRVLLRSGELQRLVEVENVWYHDGRPVLKFSGIDSISDAEPWSGASIWIPATERVELDEGEYFHEDLVGCRFEIGPPGEENGVDVGQVEAVEDHGGPALLRVKLTRDYEGAKAGKDVLIPFRHEICHDIDIARKRIRAEVPDGLLDL